MSRHVFSVEGAQTLLDGNPLLLRGLRCSNALVSDAATDDLIANLDGYRTWGVNAISVYFMGNRFGDVAGYRDDASLNPDHVDRMARILCAADDRALVVLVGCLYWGQTRSKNDAWTQTEADAAVRNTVAWLAENDSRHVFVDVDNEGMARKAKGFDNRSMLLAGKEADDRIPIATNYRGAPPEEADLAIHHSERAEGKPYVETEGSPRDVPASGGYWGPWSKKFDETGRQDEDYWDYVNIGVYAPAMQASQVAIAREHFDRNDGYFLASTWLQAAPPKGPHHDPGGNGTEDDPGIRWWLEWLEETYGPYVP